ncbi:MAG: carbohydrate ABC transporter permease [Clostridiales bacterium]|jgi:putative aldouronate transport system permease protein|nr:carbohydrate ABC transporter permease [Clostridiales bacterium]
MDNIKNPRRKPRRVEPIVFHTLNYTFLILLCAVMLYPMLNTLALSFNDGMDAVRGGIHLWPRIFTLQNYNIVLNMHTIYNAFFMSIYRTLVTVVTCIMCTSMLAYALSRPEYVLRKFITVVFVLTMYFDPGLIPRYLLIQNLGMLNTFTVYWVPVLVSAFDLIVIRTYMRSVSESLVESARIDGAGDFRIYWRVVMPLCKPVLATIALFVAVGAWNAWFDTFLYNSGAQSLSVLQYELQKLLSSAMMAGQAGQQATQAAQAASGASVTTPQALRAAITIVAAVPILLVYPFLQRYFVHGIQLGGVKE